MTFAKRPKLSKDRVADELTREMMTIVEPMGCVCVRQRVCLWCRTWPKIHRRVMNWIGRL